MHHRLLWVWNIGACRLSKTFLRCLQVEQDFSQVLAGWARLFSGLRQHMLNLYCSHEIFFIFLKPSYHSSHFWKWCYKTKTWHVSLEHRGDYFHGNIRYFFRLSQLDSHLNYYIEHRHFWLFASSCHRTISTIVHSMRARHFWLFASSCHRTISTIVHSMRANMKSGRQSAQDTPHENPPLLPLMKIAFFAWR